MITTSLRPLHHGCSRKPMINDFTQLSSPDAGLPAVHPLPEPDRNRLQPTETETKVHHWTTEVADGVLMGSIIARKRKDGSTGYRAQIILKSGGENAFREAKNFPPS